MDTMRQIGFYKNKFAQSQAFDKILRFNKAIKILQKKKPSNFLDLGCADGGFCKIIQQKLNIAEVYGVDISEKAIMKAKEKGINSLYQNIDEGNLSFPSEFFDAIFCGELIEHLFDPDHLLDEIHRVLKKDGICILTTPNLASWYNRIALLLGYQPFFSEVSIKYQVGYLFKSPFNVGHIRLFTLKALLELLKIHKFKIEKIYSLGINTELGIGKKLRFIAYFANIISNPFPSLSTNLMVVFNKK